MGESLKDYMARTRGITETPKQTDKRVKDIKKSFEFGGENFREGETSILDFARERMPTIDEIVEVMNFAEEECMTFRTSYTCADGRLRIFCGTYKTYKTVKDDAGEDITEKIQRLESTIRRFKKGFDVDEPAVVNEASFPESTIRNNSTGRITLPHDKTYSAALMTADDVWRAGKWHSLDNDSPEWEAFKNQAGSIIPGGVLTKERLEKESRRVIDQLPDAEADKLARVLSGDEVTLGIIELACTGCMEMECRPVMLVGETQNVSKEDVEKQLTEKNKWHMAKEPGSGWYRCGKFVPHRLYSLLKSLTPEVDVFVPLQAENPEGKPNELQSS